MTPLPYARQSISQADIDAVVEVLRSDWLTQGPAIGRFERALATVCDAPHASAVCNGTAGLHLAYRGLGLGPGDRLWTSPNTFVATANCALMCGAEVDFVDIDPQTWNMSVAALEAKLDVAARDGQLPKIVVPVHFAGAPCDMPAIHALSRRYGFSVVEDAAHALGARIDGVPVGSCHWSQAAMLSFHPVKIITTAEGGAVLTRDADLDARVRLLRSHGVTRDATAMEGPAEGPWYYQQTELGYNYRITDLQAALGLSQLDRLDAFVARRRALADRYDRLLEGLPIVRPARRPGRESAWHLYVIRVPAGPGARARLVDGMHGAGIRVNVHYIPVHTQPHYRRLGFAPGDFPHAERYYAEAVSLPMYASLTDADQSRVAETLRRLLA